MWKYTGQNARAFLLTHENGCFQVLREMPGHFHTSTISTLNTEFPILARFKSEICANHLILFHYRILDYTTYSSL